jgi:hypothetical protein
MDTGTLNLNRSTARFSSSLVPPQRHGRRHGSRRRLHLRWPYRGPSRFFADCRSARVLDINTARDRCAWGVPNVRCPHKLSLTPGLRPSRTATQGLDILFTPISTSHLLMFAGSNLTHEPTRKEGIVPRFARRRIVKRETFKKSASSSAVKAW